MWRLMLACCFFLFHHVAEAQSSQVPPPRTAPEGSARDVRGFIEGVGKAADGADGIVSGGRWMLEGARNIGGEVKENFGATREAIEDARKGAKGLGRVVGGLGYAADGATLYEGCQSGGSQGCVRAARSIVRERANDFARDRVLDGVFNAAAAAYPPVHAAWPAWAAGRIVGDGIRAIPLGNESSVGDEVDDFTWSKMGEPIQNRFTTGHWDPLADDAIDQEIAIKRAELQKDRREAFDRTQARNAAAAQAAADAQRYSTPVSTANQYVPAGSSFQDILNSMDSAVPNYTPNPAYRPDTASAPAKASGNGGACVPATSFDAKTGCHSGHDEMGHPGGCKCRSGSLPTSAQPAAPQVRLP